MSDTADPDLPPVTQDAPGSDVFYPSSPTAPPPPYPNPDPGQEPPPYSVYSVSGIMYPPPKAEEATCVSEPGVGCESLGNVEVLTSGEAAEPNPFDDKTVRRAFVRKVFCILTVQLLFTFTVVCVFTFSTVVKKAVQDNLWAYISSFIIFAVVAVTLSCCPSFNRRHPWNIVGLAVVTLSLSYVVGTVASFHDTTAVVITMASTLAISLAIIAYSVQNRFQFDICYLLLLVLVVDLFMFLVYCTFYYSHILDVVYGSLGALLFSLFLMIDSQMIMTRVNPEEYVSAALTMYLDIVLIFLYLMGRR